MSEKIVFEKLKDDLEAFCYQYIETYAYKDSLLSRGELLLVRRMMTIIVTSLKNKYTSDDIISKEELLEDVKYIYNGYITKSDKLSISEELLLEDLVKYIEIHFTIDD